MNFLKYTWDHLLFTADILIQQGNLTENQIKDIINLVDIKKVVTNNKLSENFIETFIKPIILAQDTSDYNALTMSDIYRIQKYNNKI